MNNDKGSFKPPKPRIFTGKNDDQDAAVVDAWIREMKDFIRMSKIKDMADQITVLQYFLSGVAKEFYASRRDLETAEEPLTLDEFLRDLKAHVVPYTHTNKYWDDWRKVSQVQGNKVRPIGEVGIEIERISYRIGKSILNEQIRIQRLLDAMHPELRLQVEPLVKRSGTDVTPWREVIQKAEQHDASLLQAGRYQRTTPKVSSNAIQAPTHQKQQ